MNYDTLQVPHIEGFESPKKLQNTNTDHTPSTLPFSFQNQKFSTLWMAHFRLSRVIDM